jgi:DNA gyrase subunit A
MATRKRTTKEVASKAQVTFATEASLIEDIDLGLLTEDNLRIYGEEVNLDRAVPDYRDGLKPVTRRTLWALHGMGNQLIKTARLGGDTVGRYHPHGENSVYGAIATQVSSPTPPIDGVGNWGSIIDPPGAPRYTNVKMSGFGRTCFFHPSYSPLRTMVDNYDGKDKEPLFIPATLPNLLLNGVDGIGLGLTTRIPAFTPESLLPVLADLALGKELDARSVAKRLKPYHEYGGELVRSPDNMKALIQLLETPKASLKWVSPHEVDEVKKTITISKFGPEVNPVKLVDDWVKAQREVSSVHTGAGVSYIIQIGRDINVNEFRAFAEKFRNKVTVSRSYELYITRRSVNKENPAKYDVAFKQVSLMELMKIWVKYRIGLEVASIKYQIRQSEEKIAYYDLLTLAANNLDIVFKSLRQADPRSYLVKHLKITPEQADQILDLKVRQLSKLDADDILAKLKEEHKVLADLKRKLKIPAQLVAEFLQNAASKFKLTVNDWSTQWSM